MTFLVDGSGENETVLDSSKGFTIYAGHRDKGEDTGPPLGTGFRLFSGMSAFVRRRFHPYPVNNVIFEHYGVSRYV